MDHMDRKATPVGQKNPFAAQNVQFQCETGTHRIDHDSKGIKEGKVGLTMEESLTGL